MNVMAQRVDTRELFAQLTEKERSLGHHSPEGRAMRTLGRALNGWSGHLMGGRDVAILCDQVIEDWLKARLCLSPWSRIEHALLLDRAVEKHWINRQDRRALQRLHRARNGASDGGAPMTRGTIQENLLLCIELVDRHWQKDG